MQPLSATGAIGPAFTHTRTVLLPVPLRVGRFFKLAFLAAVTQASFLSVSISYPFQGALAGARHSRHSAQQFAAGDGLGAFGALGVGALGLGVLAVVLVLILAFTLAYLYLLCRARATLFDLVVFRGAQVRQAWRRRGRPGRRYFGLYLLAMLIFWTILAATLGPIILRIVKSSMWHEGGGYSTGIATSLILTLAAVIWLLIPLWVALDALLQDFILPALALDDQAPIGAAFARLGSLLRRSPGQLLLFLILRTVVAFGIALALGMVLLIAVSLVALSAYGIGRLLYHALWADGLAAHTIFFAYVAGAALLVVALYLLGITAVYGIAGTFKTSYAAYFYAGYYPDLAAALTGQPPNGEVLAAAGPPLPLEIW